MRARLAEGFLLLVLVAGGCADVRGQAAVASGAAAKDAFGAEPSVVESLSSVTTMKADGTGTSVQTFVVRLQADSALRGYSVVSIPFASQSETAEFVYARVVHGDGTVEETPVSTAMEQASPVTREAPFYSDLKTKELPIRSLRVGDRMEWQIRMTETHPEVPGQIWGQRMYLSGGVVLDEVHELRVPEGMRLTVWTNPRDGAAPVETTAGGEHVYRWMHKDLKPTVGAEAEKAKHAEELRVRTPEEEVDATKGKLPSFAWTTFPDWAAVGAWYRELGAGRTEPDAAIRAKVLELTKGKTTEEARARAVYGYVAMQIRYVGVAFGVGRYQPHTAAEVFRNQYGDCKDKHTLLASMLGAAGIEAAPALIGAGVRFDAAVPSPASFNHLITRARVGGKEVWLDSTAEVAPFQALIFAIRDQEALVIPAAAPAVIERTPAMLPYASTWTTEVTGSYDKALTSESQIALTFRDDDEIILRAVLRNTSAGEYGTFVQQLMRNLGFGGTTSAAVVEHLEDSSQPLKISFHYQRVKEDDWGENRVTATFAPIGLPFPDQKTPPVLALELGGLRTETSTVEMTLPAGWSAVLPEAVHASAKFASCDVTYRQSKDKVFAERRLVVLASKVPVADFKAYKSWYDAAGASSVPYLQMVPPIAHDAGSTLSKVEVPAGLGEGVAGPSNPLAAEPIRKAGERIQAMDPDGARKLLDEAKAINATELGLWTGYAGVAELMGASAESIKNLERELKLHPEEVRLYGYVAQTQMRRGDRSGAIDALKRWETAAPKDAQAATMLVAQMNWEKRYTEGLKEERVAVARIGSDGGDLTALRLAGAQAQVGLGDKAGAAESVRPLLEGMTDPNQLNSATYMMAEADVDLPMAEAAERRALGTMDAESQGWTLTEEPRVLVGRQNLMTASWDTMGWILYREGRFAEARGYLEAALRSRDEAVIGDHLKAVGTAMGKAEVSAEARKTEQARRTFALGAAKGRAGTAEFRMLIVGGKVAAVGPPAFEGEVGEKETVFAGAEELVKAADLRALLPPGSGAHLVRSGFVTCHGAVCELVLTPISGSAK